jgi:glycogen debranching enzyme
VVSSSVRTLDSLLPVLVTRHGGRAASVFDQIFDPGAFGDEFGPRGVHVAEPSYDPSAYWRGPAWPHLTYLLGTAAGSAGRHDIASRLAVDGRRAALVSRFAEYLHPTTGRGLGAMPQSWACLAAAR